MARDGQEYPRRRRDMMMMMMMTINKSFPYEKSLETYLMILASMYYIIKNILLYKEYENFIGSSRHLHAQKYIIWNNFYKVCSLENL